MPARKTHEEFLLEVQNKYGDEYTVLGKYISTHTLIELKHNSCGNVWNTTAPYDFLKPRPNLCPKCASNRSWALTTEELQEKLNVLYNKKFTVIGSYINNKTKIKIAHSCGNVFEVKPNLILNGKYSCQQCEKSVSKVSDNVKTVLCELDINFEQEITFPWLKHRLNLYIDFFLPEYNIAIEADGEQHYIQKRVSDKEFSETMIRDKIKFTLCKENGITLIRIPSYLALHEARPVLIKALFELDVLEF